MVRRNTIGNTAEEINLDFLHEQLLLAMKKIKMIEPIIHIKTTMNKQNEEEMKKLAQNILKI